MGLLHRKRDREEAAKAAVHEWLINATTPSRRAEDESVEPASPARPTRPLRAKTASGG